MPDLAQVPARYLARMVLGGVFALLAGCGGLPLSVPVTLPLGPSDLQSAVSRTEWVIVPQSRAWIRLPGSGLVMERRFGPVAEQRVTLPNRTTLHGDNFIYLRAIRSDAPGVIRLEQALEQAGGLPQPFSRDDLSVMRSRTDELGALSWTEWSSGAGTTCVFALRRMTVSARILPRDAGALDMVMRNCVPGEVDAALAPAGADAVGFSAGARPAGHTPQRTLSTLAAPAP